MDDRFEGGMYSPRVAARIAKVRPQTFQAWLRAGLIGPAYKLRRGQTTENVYSYRDLLLIRLISRLRKEGIPTKKIRNALEGIRSLTGGDSHGWMRSAIYVSDGVIVAIIPGQESWNPIAASEGPQKLAVVFFPELMKELERELIPDRFRDIEINPAVLGGAPVIRGTRIPVQAIAEAAEVGVDPRQLYPRLTEHQIEEARAYEAYLEAA